MMEYTIMKYLRLSSEDIDLDGKDKYESYSIRNQRDYLDNFLSHMPEFKDYKIQEAIDDGWTGTNFQRPGIQRVLDFARQGKIHCIIVKDLSRFGRNYLEAGDYLEQLFPLWGVRFISINDRYDSADYNGTTGGINIAFRTLMAELYSRDLSEKVRSAKDTLSKSGKSCASYSFYGYVNDPDDHHKLIIDEPAAEIVRLIYDLYEQGKSVSKITLKLNDDGIQTASERKKEQGAKKEWNRNGKVSMWNLAMVTKILNDERYTGKHIYGKKRCMELGGRMATAVPESEWIVVPDAIPVIITDQQFNRVREIRKVNAWAKPDKSKEAELPLFSRKIRCGVCGKSLARRKSGKGFVYYCATPEVKKGLDCMTGKICESVISETVLAVLKQQTQFAENIIQSTRVNIKSSESEVARLRGEITNLKRLIEKAESAKLSLWEKHHTGNISMETYQRESDTVRKQVAAYADKATELEAQVRRFELESGQENVFVERYSSQAGIQELTQEAVNEFVHSIHIYAPDRIEIIMNYADEFEKLQGYLNNKTNGG